MEGITNATAQGCKSEVRIWVYVLKAWCTYFFNIVRVCIYMFRTMNRCMYVCMYVCICICICMYVCMYVYAFIFDLIYLFGTDIPSHLQLASTSTCYASDLEHLPNVLDTSCLYDLF